MTDRTTALLNGVKRHPFPEGVTEDQVIKSLEELQSQTGSRDSAFLYMIEQGKYKISWDGESNEIAYSLVGE